MLDKCTAVPHHLKEYYENIYYDSSQNKEGTTEYEAKSSKFALEKFYVDNATKSVLKIEEKKVSSIFWKQ